MCPLVKDWVLVGLPVWGWSAGLPCPCPGSVAGRCSGCALPEHLLTLRRPSLLRLLGLLEVVLEEGELQAMQRTLVLVSGGGVGGGGGGARVCMHCMSWMGGRGGGWGWCCWELRKRAARQKLRWVPQGRTLSGQGFPGACPGVPFFAWPLCPPTSTTHTHTHTSQPQHTPPGCRSLRGGCGRAVGAEPSCRVRRRWMRCSCGRACLGTTAGGMCASGWRQRRLQRCGPGGGGLYTVPWQLALGQDGGQGKRNALLCRHMICCGCDRFAGGRAARTASLIKLSTGHKLPTLSPTRFYP